MPYLLGTERLKGSHSMSGYHSTELCYLAAVYTNLLITKQPMDFYFKPQPDGFEDRILRVAPDILPPGSIRIGEVWIDGEPYTDFDADALPGHAARNRPTRARQGAHRAGRGQPHTERRGQAARHEPGASQHPND